VSPDTPKPLAWGEARAHRLGSRKTKGQFYTPGPVVEFMLDLAGAEAGGSVIDPACGDGAFLQAARGRGCRPVWGVDHDPEQVALCRDALGEGAVVLEGNGLDTPKSGQAPPGGFDLAVGNPPFNAVRQGVTDPAVLSRFALGRKSDGTVRARQSLEVLFLERFIALARPGGTIALIVPDGILANQRLRYVREFVLAHTTVRAVVSLPRSTFRAASTTAKTSVLLLRKDRASAGEQALMASVEGPADLPGVLALMGRARA